MKRYDIKAKKSFGQNFLIDDSALKEIVNLSEIGKNDLVIEIGPGLGNLTYYFQNSNLLLIEIDDRMLQILQDRFESNYNTTIINNDVLKINIDEEIEKIQKFKNIEFSKIKVVANLPYYITSPIIFKLLEDSTKVSEIVVMVQEEVADRIIAKSKSKDYGILTLMIQYYARATKQIIVPGSSFIPSPNVTSAIIKIIKEDKYQDIDAKIFKELVHKSFANRRKKIINSLVINKLLNLEKENIDKILKKCGISENARAEELDIDKYIEVTKQLMNL
ncbi:MAG: 16S rRNA (adenine(1518)-N(6)/adenine(1519)-N(6))-dimethyltransferase RsmA [Clostridia bacterium]|nr:16S rRNA (adenine(1518)-N(6)/adenine(1519)-N(6))-dimethyltransferase RsmA [Clostridia bacterium]MDD4386255.1 16S rRNA (adenine(1518)-N(6)/adenine(1519)-N(6))-dimethyltransferase RsmA [Clostridia bacterium]